MTRASAAASFDCSPGPGSPWSRAVLRTSSKVREVSRRAPRPVQMPIRQLDLAVGERRRQARNVAPGRVFREAAVHELP